MTYETEMQISMGLIAAIAIATTVIAVYKLRNPPLVKYKLSNGEIVECRFEIGQDIVRLRDCKNGLEYMAQTNVTRLGESE